GALRWPAAAPQHREGARGRAGGAADRRALLRPRPHRDRQDRGAHRPSRRRCHGLPRHAQHVPGAAGVRLHGGLPARGRPAHGGTGRVRSDRLCLRGADGPADEGLRDRPDGLTPAPLNPDVPIPPVVDDRYERGLAILQEVGGAAAPQVLRDLAGVAPDLGRYLVEFAYGDVYVRPGMTLRRRELAAVAALGALGNATTH